MARYVFRLRAHDDRTRNRRKFADLPAAIEGAKDELREFLSDQVRNGYMDRNLTVEICDTEGVPVATVHCTDAVKLRD